MKNLFSERYKYKNLQSLNPEEMPDTLRKRLWNIIEETIDRRLHNRNSFIEEIWDRFFKEDKGQLRDFYGVDTYT